MKVTWYDRTMHSQGRNRIQPPSYWYASKKKRSLPKITLPSIPSLPSLRPLHKYVNKTVGIGLLIMIINVGVLGAGYYYLLYTPKQKTPEVLAKKVQDQTKKKNDEMFTVVSKQITLPTDEEPMLATVSDRNELQDQAFFSVAQNGDRLLMYKKNKKIFLYRPSTKKVIAQAPLEFVDPTPSPYQMASDSATTSGTGFVTTPKVLYSSDSE